ncbi:MAG: chemotaxis protein CheW [Bacillota bacterium]
MQEVHGDVLFEELTDEDTQKNKFLIFTLDSVDYGLDISYVVEIISIQKIAPIPLMPEYVKGVINLRGKIIPIIDMRLKFGKCKKDYDDRTCIIVVDTEEITIGFIVDKVAEVTDIIDDNILPPPQIYEGFNHKFIKGIGKTDSGVKLLLDCVRLLEEEQM